MLILQYGSGLLGNGNVKGRVQIFIQLLTPPPPSTTIFFSANLKVPKDPGIIFKLYFQLNCNSREGRMIKDSMII